MASRELLAYEEIVDVIRQKRQNLNIDLPRLAQRSGIPQQKIQRIEQLRIDATYKTIYSLMDTLMTIEREETVTAAEIMTNGVKWIDKRTTVQKAQQLMYDNDYLQIPVKEEREDGTVYNIGSFTERHLDSIEDKSKQIGSVMGQSMPEVRPNTLYRDLKQLFQQGHSAVLVVDKRKYVGIVTPTDMRG